jgi:DNA-binding NarL/FixJ family response regulator
MLAGRVQEFAEVSHRAGAAPDRLQTHRAHRLAGGGRLTNVQIAHPVGLSAHTVNYHLRKVYRRLKINSRIELARFADGA